MPMLKIWTTKLVKLKYFHSGIWVHHQVSTLWYNHQDHKRLAWYTFFMKRNMSSVSKYPQLWIFHYKPTNQVINTVIFVSSNLLFSEVIPHFNSCSLSDVVLCNWHEAKMSLWIESNNVKRQCPWKDKLTENEFFSWMFQSNSSLYTLFIKY